MHIDFVSDVACPWCAVGLASLDQALATLAAEGLPAPTVRLQPFELNPGMPPGGQDAAAYLKRKYGMGDAQLAQARAQLAARGAEVGVVFGGRSRVWNTFDAHRVLALAEAEGPPGAALALKRALLQAYHRDDLDPADPALLERLGSQAGLDAARVRAVLAGDAFAAEVRAREQHWQGLGISSVPSVVVDGRHLIQGAQPPQAFVQALRQLAAAPAA